MTEVSSPRQLRFPHRPLVWISAIAISILVLATLVGATRGGSLFVLGHEEPLGLVLIGLGSLVIVSVSQWIISHHHPTASVGLALLAVGVTLPIWSSWPDLPAQMRAGLLAVAPLAVAGTSQVALAWQNDRPAPRELLWVYGVTLAAALIHLWAYNPFEDAGCSRVCLDLPSAAADILSTRAAISITALFTVLAAAIAAGAVARSPLPTPRVVIVTVVMSMALLAAPWIIRSVRWGERPPNAVLLLPLGAAALVGAAVLGVATRSRRTRVAVTRMVSWLDDAEGVLSDAGAFAGLHFAIPEENRWVDLSGRPVTEEVGKNFVVIPDSTGPVLRIPEVPESESADVLAALTRAARLALKNAQLAAITRARVVSVRASQARVVAASDAERRRIERDLHDGAQQRLVSAALYLAHAKSRLDREVPAIRQAEAAVKEALDRLRRISHGAFPENLESEGLWSGLRELASNSVVSVELEVGGSDDSIPPDVARAAYAIVAAAIQPSLVDLVRASALRDERLEISVAIFPDRAMDLLDLTQVKDRVGAVGGSWKVVSTAEGSMVEVVLPCE